MLDNGIYGLTKGQASPTIDDRVQEDARARRTRTSARSTRCCSCSRSGCGFVARTHAGNLPHLREMLREAIAYPGFAFVHVLAACVTYQTPSYANDLYERCDTAARGLRPDGSRRRDGASARGPFPARAPLPEADRGNGRSRLGARRGAAHKALERALRRI